MRTASAIRSGWTAWPLGLSHCARIYHSSYPPPTPISRWNIRPKWWLLSPAAAARARRRDHDTEAKARILAAQVVGDVAVLGLDDPVAASLAWRAEHEVAYFSGEVPVDVGAWLVNDTLICRPRFDLPMEKVCTISDINLRGYHNVMNTLAACAPAGCRRPFMIPCRPWSPRWC